MSENDMSTDDTPSGPAADVHQRMDALSRRLRAVEEENDDLRDEVADVRETVNQRDAVIERQAERIHELERRTDLLQLVEDADEMTATQRSAALLQHLKRKAENRADGEPPRATVDRDGADEALHFPDVERTTIYRDMERCERLVGDGDVCEYADGELVLRLDVDGGTDAITPITGGENL